jgi:hypothetical protein
VASPPLSLSIVEADRRLRRSSWSIHADVVRKLDRNEQELPTPPSEPTAESDEAPF